MDYAVVVNGQEARGFMRRSWQIQALTLRPTCPRALMIASRQYVNEGFAIVGW